jgi:uncharacterized membrane protein HdeD (DUF308 family)
MQSAHDPLDTRSLPGALTGAWWLFLLLGVLGVVAGIIVLVVPKDSLATLAVVSGIFLLVDGIFELVSTLGRGVEHRGLLIVVGVLSVIAGVILVRHPFTAVVAFALLVGVWLITVGIIRVFEWFGGPERGVWGIVVAVLEVLGGIVIVAIPGIGLATLAVLIGIAFILRGVAMSAIGWELRRLRSA